MTKREFIAALRASLSGLPTDEIEQQINYYSEMIDDRMEDGLSEEAAVSQIGNFEEILEQLPKPEKKKRRLKTGEIVLLGVGSPVWLPLLIAAAAVVLSIYVSWWAIVVSLWAVFVSLAASAFAVLLVWFYYIGTGMIGLALIGAALACAGLSVFAFFGCYLLTKATIGLTKKLALGLKNLFTKKEEAK